MRKLILFMALAAQAQILDPNQAKLEAQVYTASHVPILPQFRYQADWERYAADLRKRILDEIVFRGEAVKWRAAKTAVEYLETIEAPGYRLKKLRYEAIPGLWIPGLIYEPAKLSGKVPVVINVNGHERTGIATPYIQERCINLARKGVIAVNIEWLGRGQLETPGFNHYRMPQIDLAGTSGLAVFYLAMQRALDIGAAHPNADPARVAVTGLSGGGWQTILLSALDTRVALANPVAGYSSFVTRAQWPDLDLGDSEQTPSDLASIADYTHLTALVAPRALQLAYNAKDNCCFRADYAIGPLMQAADPIWRLFNAQDKLRYYINHGDGHNYNQDNRESFYRMLRDSFFQGNFDAIEQPVDNEVRSAEQLLIPLPENNLDFHKIALSLSQSLPNEKRPTVARLNHLTRVKRYAVEAFPAGEGKWKLVMDRAWTVPAEEHKPEAGSTVLLFADRGRAGATAQIQRLVESGNRVVAIDPFYFGESQLGKRDFLFAMLVASLGERPLGVQASQVMAAARWLGQTQVHAVGPRSSLIALVAAALEEKAITGVTLEGAYASLKEILEKDLTVQQTPELFCFGLLAAFDVPQLKALIAPRRVTTSAP
jgi:dienelactone hydrolase